MKIQLLAMILLLSLNSSAQSRNEVDSVSKEICKTISLSQETNDSLRLTQSMMRHLEPILENIKSDSEAEEYWNKIFFNLQKSCKIFWDLIQKITPPNDHWQEVQAIPASKLSDKEFYEFKRIKAFYYLEPNGDTTKVQIDQSNWKEIFADHSYSFLEMEWLDQFTYELTFIESNHEIRKNMSLKGDSYQYHLLEKLDDHFLVCTGIPGGIRFSLFKLYYK